VLLEVLVLSVLTLLCWASCSVRLEGLKCLHVQVKAGLFSCKDEGAVLLQNIADCLPSSTPSQLRRVDPSRISGVSVWWAFVCFLSLN
jgi:hypothetical protein